MTFSRHLANMSIPWLVVMKDKWDDFYKIWLRTVSNYFVELEWLATQVSHR